MEGEVQPDRWRVRLWLTCIAGLLLLLAIGEIVARVVLGLGTPVLYAAHPTIEYMLRPNQDVMRFGRHTIVNQYGMRTVEFPDHKADPRELRILVLGDSVVNGGVLTDHADLATTLLAERLTRDLSRSAIVGNVSAGSWGPQNLLAWIEEFGILDADVVILVLSSHDASDVPTFAPLNEMERPTSMPPAALWEGVMRYLPRYLPTLVTDSALTPEVGAESLEPREEAVTALRQLIATVRRAGSCVAMVQHLTTTEMAGGPGPGFEAMAVVADQEHVVQVDLPRLIRAAERRGLPPYRGDIHLTEAGQAALAGALLQAVDECQSGSAVSTNREFGDARSK